MSYIKTLPASDIQDGEMRAIGVEETDVLLIKHKGVVHAYLDRCAHRETPLSEGIFKDGVLTCHAHFWEYDPETGKTIDPPGSCLKKFSCKVEDGFIFINVESDSAVAQP